MFTNVSVTGNSLTLTLDNTAGNGLMIADAFRLEQLIPEPSSALLTGLAAAAFALRRRRP